MQCRVSLVKYVKNGTSSYERENDQPSIYQFYSLYEFMSYEEQTILLHQLENVNLPFVFDNDLLLFLLNFLCLFLFQEVTDISGGCGSSFAVEIVSEQFEGKRLLERHRMVNAALEEEMKEIHALSVKKAVTPEQWKKQQESNQSNPAA
ncbi:BolA family transcriptional regulator [Medicago truncatula]|uniref:BolA family transcriptional regulator n=2 Tax=Trifolieae TaxID=163742 RepID=A0A072TU06_MEDTR|nr:BolA family transcriptional regulator [Medicago truncatula]